MFGWILENPVVGEERISCCHDIPINSQSSASADDSLSAEAVEGLALTLECVDDVHGSDSLTTGVLGVGDGITDDILEEDLEDAASLLVDETGDTLDTATTSETTDSGLGDALDVITQDLAVTLGASLSKSLASFSSTRHDELVGWLLMKLVVNDEIVL